MAVVPVTVFTDPYCPWSWAAEPHLRRLETEFAGQVALTFVLVGLHRTIDAPVKLALDALDAAAQSGMPVDARVFLRDPPASTHPAGLAVQAVREQADPAPFIRRLREAILVEGRRMDTAPALLDAARETGGLDLERLRVDFGSNAMLEAFGADLERARAVDATHHEPGTGRVRLPSIEAHAADGQVRGAYGWAAYEAWRDAVAAAGGEPVEARLDPVEALRRFRALATPEVAAVSGLPAPRAEAELWRLAMDWRVRRRGPLWEAA